MEENKKVKPDRQKRIRDDFFEEEREMDRDLQRMRAFYPENAAVIQRYVEDACDRMDYEGSRMYDEYPDKYMMHRTCQSIYNRIKEDAEKLSIEAGSCRNCHNMQGDALQDLIDVLFFHEVFRRRSRRRRCRRCVW